MLRLLVEPNTVVLNRLPPSSTENSVFPPKMVAIYSGRLCSAPLTAVIIVFAVGLGDTFIVVVVIENFGSCQVFLDAVQPTVQAIVAGGQA